MSKNGNKEFWNKRDDDAIQAQRGAIEKLAHDIKQGADLSSFARKWAATILRGMSESEPKRGKGRPPKVAPITPEQRKAYLDEAATALLDGRTPKNAVFAAETLRDWSRGLEVVKPANRPKEYPHTEIAITYLLAIALGKNKKEAMDEATNYGEIDVQRVYDTLTEGSPSRIEAEQWLSGATFVDRNK